MNSKEALKRLKQETTPATYMADFDKEECIEIIQQDLDRLEKLERFKTRLLEDTNKLYNENQKFKKVIDILKNNLCIEFSDDFNGIKFKRDLYDECDYTILFLKNNEQYELLKEVLEND